MVRRYAARRRAPYTRKAGNSRSPFRNSKSALAWSLSPAARTRRSLPKRARRAKPARGVRRGRKPRFGFRKAARALVSTVPRYLVSAGTALIKSALPPGARKLLAAMRTMPWTKFIDENYIGADPAGGFQRKLNSIVSYTAPLIRNLWTSAFSKPFGYGPDHELWDDTDSKLKLFIKSAMYNYSFVNNGQISYVLKVMVVRPKWDFSPIPAGSGNDAMLSPIDCLDVDAETYVAPTMSFNPISPNLQPAISSIVDSDTERRFKSSALFNRNFYIHGRKTFTLGAGEQARYTVKTELNHMTDYIDAGKSFLRKLGSFYFFFWTEPLTLGTAPDVSALIAEAPLRVCQATAKITYVMKTIDGVFTDTSVNFGRRLERGLHTQILQTVQPKTGDVNETGPGSFAGLSTHQFFDEEGEVLDD